MVNFISKLFGGLQIFCGYEWFINLPYLDGAMIENFAIDWKGDEYLDLKLLQHKMKIVFTTQPKKKISSWSYRGTRMILINRCFL
jgi:hypothetical protein